MGRLKRGANPATSFATVTDSASYPPSGIGVIRPYDSHSSSSALADLDCGQQLRPADPARGRGVDSCVPAAVEQLPLRIGQRRLLTARQGIEMLPNDFQGQVVVPLHPQHLGQPLNVLRTEFAVSGRRPARFDQALGLQEANLGDGHFRELVPQPGKNRADAHQWIAARGGAVTGTARRCSQHGPSLGSHAPLARVEDQSVLADLDLVTVRQQDRIDPLTIDVRAVQAAHVRHGEMSVASSPEFHMAP